MNDPYAVLDLALDSDDEAIRRRYLELVKKHTPEREPEKFAAIRGAYEQLRDVESRLHYRLFEVGREETVAAILEELACRTPRLRQSLEKLLSVARR